MEKKKVTKWDLKKAAKLLGLEWNSTSEQKMRELAGEELPEIDNSQEEPSQEETELGQGLLSAMEEAAKPQGIARVAYDVVEFSPGKYRLLEIVYDTSNANILLEADNEPKCIMKMQHLVAERRMKEIRGK
jgi:hypothetical protein